jgi:phosphoribosylanthranilate isomerase
MKVKICGIKDVETALGAVENGADAIGFVFAESKRKIDVETAKEIVKELPDFVMKIGVFVNETKEEIDKISAYVGLTHLQLHGDEIPEFCQEFVLPVIKAFSIEHKNDLEKIKQYSCEYILLDGPKGQYPGGYGKVFNWNFLKTEDFKGKHLILAGGLHEENIQSAIKRMNPYMVDVSSGVETSGKKDLCKIQSFIDKVKVAFWEGK